MRPHAIACLVLLIAVSVSPAGAGSRPPDLDTWMKRELTPYIAGQLATHPRFRNAPVRFVVMRDGNPQSTSNELALALRDQLQDALVDTPGIRIAWQPDRKEINGNPGISGIDCTANDVHYYIGLEVSETRNSIFAVSVRALDLEERSWVAGFGQSWQGMLSTRQHHAWRQFAADPSFRGDREVPYQDSQADMLAAHLAHELACTLMRQVSGEYVAELSAPGTRSTDNMLELIRNNLAQYRALQFSAGDSDTNAVIEGKAHRIDQDLYQYWVTVRPKEASAELPALSASAYVYLPQEFMAASVVPELQRNDVTNSASVLSSLRIVRVDDPGLCASDRLEFRRPQFNNAEFAAAEIDCHALQAVTSDDAVLFFLQHQLNNGLVRLSDQACERRTHARIARAGQELRFVLPAETFATVSWHSAEDWQLNPAADTYYAIAVSDTQAARAVARQFSQLPQRCGRSLRTGLEGRALENWLQEFASIASRWQQHVDWQIIRVKNVF